MSFYTQGKTREKAVVWQVQEAKAMFSEVIKAAAVKPQTITIRGKETAVILSIDEYRKLARPKQTLYEFIQNSPFRGVELELPQRFPEKMRDVSL
ncbi:MAG: type II toxin-antitoxin system Phd/YefM family antitoxin [Treponema sp.]|jgi:prevent-host-death family protein|nr:type II toxin-antitoxin system Phd/YefM family antitoxin [Treponema sp.]